MSGNMNEATLKATAMKIATEVDTTTFRHYFPDAQYNNGIAIAEDNFVAVLFTVTGTHTQPVLGFPPTGRQITMAASCFVDFNGAQPSWWVINDYDRLFNGLAAASAQASQAAEVSTATPTFSDLSTADQASQAAEAATAPLTTSTPTEPSNKSIVEQFLDEYTAAAQASQAAEAALAQPTTSASTDPENPLDVAREHRTAAEMSRATANQWFRLHGSSWRV